MKKSVLLKILTVAMAVAIICFGATSAYAADNESFLMNSMAHATYSANYGLKSGTYSNYGLKYGSVNNLQNFDSYNSDKDNLYLAAKGQQKELGVADNTSNVLSAQGWRWYVAANEGVIAVFDITKNCKFTSTATNIGGWKDVITVNIYLKVAGELITIKSTTNPSSVDALCSTIYAKSGDSIYIEAVIPSSVAGTRNLTGFQDTTITFSDEFNASAYNAQIPTMEQTIKLGDAVNATASADYDYVSGKVVNYSLKYGNVNNLNDFDTSSDKKLTTSQDESVIVQDWKWTINKTNGVVAVFEAKFDCKVQFKDVDNLEGWVDDTAINVYLKKGNQTPIKLVSVTVEDNSNTMPNDWEITVNAKAGDIVYFEFATVVAVNGTRNLQHPPQVYTINEFDQTAYDGYTVSGFMADKIVMTEGAATRISQTNSGIKFEVNINKYAYNYLASIPNAVVSKGMLIVPYDYISDGTEFTIEGLEKANKEYLDIPSDAFLETTTSEKTYKFWGSIVNIKPANYTRDFAGIGYIKVEVNGVTEYVYASFDVNNVRNVYEIAKEAYQDTDIDGNPIYNENQLGILKGFIDKVVDVTIDGETITYNGGVENYVMPYQVTKTESGYQVTSSVAIYSVVVNGQKVDAEISNDGLSATFTLA